jgi:hypothetical protein
LIVDTRTWVEEQRAKLAKSANRFVENAAVREALTALDPTALRTLLGAAANASCLDEVLILLRYQQGRDRVKWRDVLVAGMEKELKELVENAKKGRAAPDEPDAAEALLATSWLGFLVQIHRYHYEAAREGAREARRG